MKAILIDDDPHSIKLLKKLLRRYFPEISVIGEGESVEYGVETINLLKPDLVLLDIQIIHGTGFDIIDQLDYNPLIVFISSHDNFTLNAIKAEACDYVLKPLVEQEFIEAILKCKRRYNLQIKENEANTTGHSFISITGKTDVFLNIDDVNYFESWGSYTYCHMQDEKLVISIHLGELEKKLPKSKFFRTHRKYLINISKVSHFKIKNRIGQVVLYNKTEIAISARKINEFKKMLNIL